MHHHNRTFYQAVVKIYIVHLFSHVITLLVHIVHTCSYNH